MNFNSASFALDATMERLKRHYENPQFVCCEYPKWLEEITYKPGWGMAIICESGSGWIKCEQGVGWPLPNTEHRLITVATVDDAYHPGKETMVAFNQFIRSGYSQDGFIDAVAMQLKECEEHEFNEFFRVNGVAIRNPH